MLKNKHVIAALIITPLLSILGYFAVDFLVTEKPQAAVSGQTYELVAKPACRYASGHCSLVNGAFALDLTGVIGAGGRLFLQLRSVFPLQGGKIAIVDQQNPNAAPVDLLPRDDSGLRWSIALPGNVSPEHHLQLAVSARDSLYFGETVLAFTRYETAFGMDFREKPAGEDDAMEAREGVLQDGALQEAASQVGAE